MRWPTYLASIALVLFASHAQGADEDAPNRQPVKAIADARLAVGNQGILPLYLSSDWALPLPAISRAVIVLHGRLRNADVYYQSATTAQFAAGDEGKSTLMIVPQFLAEIDIEAHKLPADTLRWSLEGWEGGDAALAPSPVSSFEALDAILARLSDRRIFPNLKQVVVAGHSGGGQVAQRYAIAGKGEATLSRQHIEIRYVVANPSSYAYFSKERPERAIAASCPGYNNWKYGMDERPPYLADATPAALEARYVEREVIYLLGTLDTNPEHSALDKSCMAKAQGPFRYARGHAYAEAMAKRDKGTPNHKVWDVAGVGHDGDKMLTSKCGLAALFDLPGCTADR
ncbi:alpha/beta hydrolase [Bradyrhizobium manausense]|uniref:alpha/beta hydrolase n=1 Tax=Bradyrhizobium TaxID=374 RepID=UPI001BA4FDC6|nr:MULTISPECIES: alpha/beta hydrolase [Bradyrhizobium]MBR0826617.1 alpha/beta hydrolase [Bradyrhizobium manausense]UVO29006.1 alpha/beta hydrolase [Bradyrhizobium arachidis]